MLRRRLASDESGLAAIEFALILPLMVTLFFGVVELSLALACRTDVVNMTVSAADLVAQKSSISTTDITAVKNAANTILYPYFPNTPTPASIRITSVNDDGSGVTGKVAWVCTQLGNDAADLPARTIGSTVSFSNSLMTKGGSVIIVDVAYKYTSPTNRFVVKNMKMSNTFYTRPRRVAQISGPASGSCDS